MRYKICLREILELRGMSQTEAAARTGLSRQTVNNLCRPGASRLEVETFEKLFVGLGVEPGDLIKEDKSGV